MAEIWKEQAAQDFAEIVTSVVNPEQNGGYGEAFLKMSGLAVRFCVVDPAKYPDIVGGLFDGFGSVPKYAVNVTNVPNEDHILYDPSCLQPKVHDSATFGMNKKSIYRTLAVSLPDVKNPFRLAWRKLDPEESHSLLTFMRSPHLSHEALGVMLRRTPAEEAFINDEIQQILLKRVTRDGRYGFRPMWDRFEGQYRRPLFR